MFPLYTHRPFLSFANEICYLFIYSSRDELYEDFNSASTSLKLKRQVDVLDLGTCDVRGSKQIPWKMALDG